MTAAARAGLAAAAFAAFAAFCALGWWQLERRAWKHALVARVEQRIHADPVPAPGPAEWPQVDAARFEYRRVRIAGTLRHDLEATVQALSVLGAGFWVLTPLARDDGTIVLVNRGFVPPERRDRLARADADPGGPVEIVGLLRLSEPGGGFLRRNDPAADRWTSRDVQAIAASRRLANVAPYFVDAEGAAGADAPVGGLTVVAFADNHLVYAITWFALAALVVVAAVVFVRLERRAAAID